MQDAADKKESNFPAGTQALEQAAGLLGEKKHVRLGGLRGSAAAWALSRLLGRGRRPSLVVCPTPEQALAFFEDLRSFTESGAPAWAAPDRATLYYLPAWEQRPYDNRSPSVEHLATRMEALFALLRRPEQVTIVLPVAALLQKTAPADVLGQRFEYLLTGQESPFEELPQRLTDLGYRRGPRVEDRGEFAIKGGMLDIFPPGYSHPLRLEFVGDTLEEVRPFDQVTQRSLQGDLAPAEVIEEVLLLPMREIFFDDVFLERAIKALSKEQQDDKAGFRFVSALKDDLRSHQAVAGIEYLLSHFYGEVPTLLEHLPADAPIALVEPRQIEREFEVVGERLAMGYGRRREEELPAADPICLFADAGAMSNKLLASASLILEEMETGDEEGDGKREAHWSHLTERTVRARSILDGLPGKLQAEREGSPLAPIAGKFREWLGRGWRVVVASHTVSQQERMAQLLAPYDISFERRDELSDALVHLAGSQAAAGKEREPLHLVRVSITEGFEAPEAGLVLLTEEEILGTHRRKAPRAAPKLENLLTDLSDLQPGDYIVHSEHGVGRFRSLEHLVVDRHGGDFLLLEYAGSDKLYVPAGRIRQVARYSGPEGYEPTLDKLGGARWKNTRKKIRESIYKLAAELLELYASRQALEGYAFPSPDAHYRAFEAAFEFDETPDQERAISEVLSDMQRPHPMDRLVCGDVGFGKTEVALRAAFLSVLAKKQVAVLVPTTVLAEQHLLTFRHRFEKEGVRVEALSRLQTTAEQKKILEDVAGGKVDVVIGTHRLLQRDIQFRDLGLLIIDEEQRFGVKHKEQIKKLRRMVHVLTLTATPIPRTLHMAMTGVRDLSIIATPPTDRLSIRTVVTRRSDRTIQEAVQAEVDRGGQVFFVHNRVQTIEEEAAHLREILPGVRMEIAHGQMPPGELERVMTAFLRGEFQVLLCTSIIENGLDIPNANTLIVDHADHFGLAQLYQIRGRVGRGSRRAYAYLMLPESGRITDDAEKRLQVLQEHSDLGAGFRIATYDLELRGGGNLLGDAQSGHIAAIGLELYTELLEEAVHELRGEEYHERIDPEVNLGVEAFLPDTYVPDLGEKLSYYKKLSSAPDAEALQNVADELFDCYGTPPPEVRNLLDSLRIALLLRELNVVALDLKGCDLTLTFHQDLSRGVKIDSEKLLGLVTAEPQRYRLRPDLRFLVHLAPGEAPDPVGAVNEVLKALT